jgi:hypothetical protein
MPLLPLARIAAGLFRPQKLTVLLTVATAAGQP